ncbi:hypothetical protein PHYSODRAFT_333580 [Phytophthora sojae]|uniref:Glycosyltransferase family 28 N-terminal domain-containing protein n=1 Tax=Phytophthora sojae (strain P6497) TaxID=1094619 RepID=G4ZLX6_PHYSP|nr:hypothetical protein PHYSODRAFT_333580 [Phytophthora sojae]EGZ15311.1 hypothetical protein PHYSODRAFT_333580 [Phytophthora sojae]|eukprot:XP_009529060.1 hypothetical protein PHYSODRAFT_333580 [Phytophthora sojae]
MDSLMKNKRKKGSLISGNNKVLDALGFKSRNVHNGSMSADEEVEGEQPLSRQIAVKLTPEERSTLEARFRALMKERELGVEHLSFTLASDSSSDSISSEGSGVSQENDAEQPEDQIDREQAENLNAKPPRMNICMMVTGSREGSVQHEATTTKFLQYIHRQAENKARRRSWLLDNVRHRDPFAEMKDLRELVFSLWPACLEADPLAPGKTFRADAIIAHPCVFGQAIVAERLGVSLHCMGDAPQSRTQAFPYLTSSSTDLHLPYHEISDYRTYPTCTKTMVP